MIGLEIARLITTPALDTRQSLISCRSTGLSKRYKRHPGNDSRDLTHTFSSTTNPLHRLGTQPLRRPKPRRHIPHMGQDLPDTPHDRPPGLRPSASGRAINVDRGLNGRLQARRGREVASAVPDVRPVELRYPEDRREGFNCTAESGCASPRPTDPMRMTRMRRGRSTDELRRSRKLHSWSIHVFRECATASRIAAEVPLPGSVQGKGRNLMFADIMVFTGVSMVSAPIYAPCFFVSMVWQSCAMEMYPFCQP